MHLRYPFGYLFGYLFGYPFGYPFGVRTHESEAKITPSFAVGDYLKLRSQEILFLLFFCLYLFVTLLS